MVTGTEPRKALLTIENRHVDAAPELEVDAADYLSYFQNELGEQWIFVRRAGAAHGTVYGGDLGWEGHEVRPRDLATVRAEMAEKSGLSPERVEQMWKMLRPDPLVPDLVMEAAERAWLNLAWQQSCTAQEQDAALDALAQQLATEVPADMLNKDPMSMAYRGAHQTLALLVGRAAGMRGLSDDAVPKLYERVLKATTSR